jgi:ADP-heptose:LPS heptosyltransferase
MIGQCGPGDVYRVTPYLAAVRESRPAAEITLVVPEEVFPVVAHARTFDRIVVSRFNYDRRLSSRLWTRLNKARQLARLIWQLGTGYDLVITFMWGTTALNVLGWLVGRERIGYANALPKLLSCDLGQWRNREDGFHEQNVALLSAAGIDPGPSTTLRLIHDRGDDADIQRLLAEHGLGDGADFIVLHPGSDWACQRWLSERWALLGDALIASHRTAVVFTGLAGERAYINGIRQLMRAGSISLAGRTTLPQLGALLGRARLCVCVDSVVHELTQAVGIPAVVLAGPSPAEHTAPGPRRRLIVNRTTPQLKQAINSCREQKFHQGGCLDETCPMAGLRDIEISDALQAVQSLLADNNPCRPIGSVE